jgi:hypothetical protein
MKRLPTLISIFAVLLVTLGISVFAEQNFLPQHSVKEDIANSLPPGKWSLGYRVSTERGAVVDLFSVSSDAAKGLTVTSFSVQNRSNRNVVAVKVSWVLYEKSKPQTILLQGEMPQFLRVALAPKEKRSVTFPVVSFAQIYHPLLRGGSVEGNLKIELTVSDVLFEPNVGDQGFSFVKTRWVPNLKLNVLEVPNAPVPPPDDGGELGCPERECEWSKQDNCYRCELRGGSTCAWRKCSECASGRCPGLLD